MPLQKTDLWSNIDVHNKDAKQKILPGIGLADEFYEDVWEPRFSAEK